MSETEKDTTGIRVFVYGTLKEGHGNHGYYLRGNPAVEYLGRCTITGPYLMHDTGFFPMVYEVSGVVDQPIVGEVYRIDHDTLDALDMLEGHPNWYRRHQVDTPFKKAWCYFMQDDIDIDEIEAVENGCWHPTEDELTWLAK